MKKSSFLILLLTVCVSVFFVSCKKDYEELEFSGKVVYGTLCSTQTYGYIIALDTPADFGQEVEIGGVKYPNAVIGYESPKILKDQWQVSGVFYETKGYGKVHCMLWSDYINMKEVIFLEVNHD